ncbi:hypothetical protein [Methanocella sp. MCL-LM]|uniref:hypothetical protein n=1 Tax=Methanocella sp. MCL-LM TaxID=3412035 RepID=UPI003C770311
MRQRYLQAILIGIVAGVILIISHVIFVAAGFTGSFIIPFFGCALGCVEWLLVAAFLAGVGWYTANYTWANKSDAITLSALAGLAAGVVNQSIGLLVGLILIPIAGIIGAIAGYAVAGDYNPLFTAGLAGAAGIALALLVILLQFLFWVVFSVVFSAIGGAIYSAQTRK